MITRVAIQALATSTPKIKARMIGINCAKLLELILECSSAKFVRDFMLKPRKNDMAMIEALSAKYHLPTDFNSYFKSFENIIPPKLCKSHGKMNQ